MPKHVAQLVDVVVLGGRVDSSEMLQRLHTLAVSAASLREVDDDGETVQDAHFDAQFHVRLEALPDPRSVRELKALATRLLAEPLAPSRPGWTLHYVEKVSRNRSALIIRRLASYDARILGALNGTPLESREPHSSDRFDVSRILTAVQRVLNEPDPVNALIDRTTTFATRAMQDLDHRDAPRSTCWNGRSSTLQLQDLRIAHEAISSQASRHGVDERSLLLSYLVETASRMHESVPVEALVAGIAVRRSDATSERLARVMLPTSVMPFAERLHAIEETLLHLPDRPLTNTEFREWIPPALARMIGAEGRSTSDLAVVFAEPIGTLSGIGVQRHTVLPMVSTLGAAVSMIATVEGNDVRLGFTVDPASGTTATAVRTEFEQTLRTHLEWDDETSRLSRWWATLQKRSATT